MAGASPIDKKEREREREREKERYVLHMQAIEYHQPP